MRLLLRRTKVIADIGINHNGSLEIAKEIIRACKSTGVDYVKFQKREPDVCVPEEQKNLPKETLWGLMKYIDYRKRMEFSLVQYEEIAEFCKWLEQKWFFSIWDEPSLRFAKIFDCPYIKIPSAKITDYKLLEAVKKYGRPTIISTGGCTQDMVDDAMAILGNTVDCIMQCTSTYPCKEEEINLKVIDMYRHIYPHIMVGYSNHFAGMTGNLGAVALGADMIELHVTLNTAMLGSDHSASCPTDKLPYLIKHIETMEAMLGDGKKQYYESERPVMAKLR